MRYLSILFMILLLSCGFSNKENKESKPPSTTNSAETNEQDAIQLAHDFDFPVGKPNAVGYYNAQPFGDNNHLGDDWNAETGVNSDLGDPIYSVAVGKVVFAEDLAGSWRNVIRVVHYLPNGLTYESVYAHCENINAKDGDWVDKGEQIATIGNANGIYLAHLHLEIRDSVGMVIGGGYSENQTGYIDPTAFIKSNRKPK